MRMTGRDHLIALALAILAFCVSGCAKQSDEDASCPQPPQTRVTGSTGSALVFAPDPRQAAQDPTLGPKSDLDPYRTRVSLQRLTGKGILEGQYVDVRTNIGSCQETYGALSPDNTFEFSEKDTRFQETMSYFYGDSYQSALSDAGVEVAPAPIHIVAHCMPRDNAFFQVLRRSDGSTEEQVCLGDSIDSRGAYYADDAYVIVHELQHGTTMRHYSLTHRLGEFYYDEGGALNEGISDFMALMYLSPLVKANPRESDKRKIFDERIFSSWALGTFSPLSASRGAHRCPVYDPSWPECGNFPNFDGAKGQVSYVYPEGIGWGYADNYSRPNINAMVSAFMSNRQSEEIHNNAVIIEGALWEIFDELRRNHKSHEIAQALMMNLVAKTLRDLPKPDSTRLSPVTFRGFAESLQDTAEAMDLSVEDMAAVTANLELRGLLGGTVKDGKLVDKDLLVQGPGQNPDSSHGLRIEDDAATLRGWLRGKGMDSSIVHEGPANGKLDAGETAVLWFDLQNLSDATAGGVTLTITSDSPDVTFIRGPNPGWISSNKVQIQYAKINGAQLVRDLSQTENGHTFSFTDNSYFKTNPEYKFASQVGMNLTTGVWVQVSPSAVHQKGVTFKVHAKPANGETSDVDFDATIQ